MAQQAGNTEALHIQRLERVLEYKSQSLHDKSRRNESIRIYERETQYAIDNGKGLKRSRIDETLLEAEAKKKQSCSNSSSNNQEIEEDWTGKGNTVVP
ncbi:MAG: hypothetical protein EZS28_039034 [Streblomastix strix]|uniref:Uncharacterized protein n=1 Tax=Streblomastix strix TaxID=222440 RepID=A0A5J4U514_9EUKA|nr:MAG: hypothetical protein EZS28_039034 [Streblomastix strix]